MSKVVFRKWTILGGEQSGFRRKKRCDENDAINRLFTRH